MVFRREERRKRFWNRQNPDVGPHSDLPLLTCRVFSDLHDLSNLGILISESKIMSLPRDSALRTIPGLLL